MKDIIRFENIHIPLWLLKDTCWLMEWKIAGITMIIPTLSVAIYIASKTFSTESFWINLAVCCWITANSHWMICEFISREELKYYSAIPFVAGIIFVSIFYIRKLLIKNFNNS